MNAMTQQTLPGLAPAPSAMLSRMDLSDVEVAKDADFEFRRCGCDADLAAWARKWGAAATLALLNRDGHSASQDDLEEAEQAATAAEEARDKLRSVVEGAVKALDIAMERAPDAIANKVGEITSKLEEAL